MRDFCWRTIEANLQLRAVHSYRKLASIRIGVLIRRGAADFCCESGNVESALTLIPLLILFLTVGQVCLSVYSRTVSGVGTQGAIAYAAMGSAESIARNGSGVDSINQEWSAPPQALPLPGGGSLLIGERKVKGISITPLLPQGDAFTTDGVAVQE